MGYRPVGGRATSIQLLTLYSADAADQNEINVRVRAAQDGQCLVRICRREHSTATLGQFARGDPTHHVSLLDNKNRVRSGHARPLRGSSEAISGRVRTDTVRVVTLILGRSAPDAEAGRGSGFTGSA
jgi:hypothetical protein